MRLRVNLGEPKLGLDLGDLRLDLGDLRLELGDLRVRLASYGQLSGPAIVQDSSARALSGTVLGAPDWSWDWTLASSDWTLAICESNETWRV